MLSRSATTASPGIHDLQLEADARRGPVPDLLEDYEGAAALETFTVFHDRSGAPEWAPVVLRTPAGARVLAAAATDSVMQRLTDARHDPIGIVGQVTSDLEGLLRWTS